MTDLAAAVSAELDRIEAGFGYYHRIPLLAALRAVVAAPHCRDSGHTEWLLGLIADKLGIPDE